MNSLVKMYNDKPMVSSLHVASKFKKAHSVVLRKIRTLDCSDEFRLNNFAESNFTNDKGREYESFMITRDGFAFLCMGFTGKQAAAWKEKYITAFNQMEKRLSRKTDDLQWKQARLQSTAARKDVTDTIKDFVDYATDQGSKSAFRYYSSITKMEYAALEILQYTEKVPDKFRDTLDCMELSFLMTAEYIAKNALQAGIDEGLHYKEIYILAKTAVNNYADTVKLPQLQST